MRLAVYLIIFTALFDRLAAQECCACDQNHHRSNNGLPHEGGRKLLRGKAGSKGEKGDPGPKGDTPVCDCSSVQSTIDVMSNEMSGMKLQLNSLLALTRRNCHQIKQLDPAAHSGVYTIYPSNDGQSFEVKCDMDTEGGGWIIFQDRFDGSENFDRDWDDYVQGFGDLNNGEEGWLGLEKLHILTTQQPCELRIDLTDFEGGAKYAKYNSFSITAADDYQLILGEYSGDAGDSLTYHKDQRFTTRDRDQDPDKQNCAVTYRGAWWHKGCHKSNLNGLYLRGNTDQFATGMVWLGWKGYHYALKTSKMMFRPIRN